MRVILPMLPYLPPDFFSQDPPIEIAFSQNDNAAVMLHHEFEATCRDLSKAGRGEFRHPTSSYPRLIIGVVT